MDKTQDRKKYSQNSYDVFPSKKDKDLWEAQIGAHYSSMSNFRKEDHKKITGHVQYSSLGGLKILEIYLGACNVFQGLDSVKKNDKKEDVICQLLILSGSCSLAFGNDDSIYLKKGEIFILDSTKPINFQVEKSAHCLAIYMPLALIKGWITRNWDKLDTRLIKTNTKQGSLLKGYMQLIQKHSQTQQSDPLKNTSYKRAFVPLMVANLSMLVYTILDLKKNKSKAIKDIQLDAAKAHILVHLTDPFISPKTIS